MAVANDAGEDRASMTSASVLVARYRSRRLSGEWRRKGCGLGAHPATVELTSTTRRTPCAAAAAETFSVPLRFTSVMRLASCLGEAKAA